MRLGQKGVIRMISALGTYPFYLGSEATCCLRCSRANGGVVGKGLILSYRGRCSWTLALLRESGLSPTLSAGGG